MDKIVRIGVGKEGDVFARVKISLTGNLSITGVVGPKANGDCRGACGQIIMSAEENFGVTVFATGWDADLCRKFMAIWREWHLNDMTAGSPAQRAWIKANPLDYKYPKSHFVVYAAALEQAGLNPDPNYLHNGKPYGYGTAWLKRELPADIIAFLESLPETDKTPAWC